MKKFYSLTSVVVLASFLIGCPPVEQSARDSIAASYGFIITAQQKNLASCQADSTQAKCKLINKAIDAHTLAQDALHTYCLGDPATSPSYLNGGPCVPVKSAADFLKAAVENLDTLIEDVKELI